MIFLAVIFGIALKSVGQVGEPVIAGVGRLTEVVFKVLSFVMKAAPLGAFGAMSYAIGKFGLSTLTSLGSLILLFYVTSALFVVVVLGGVLAAYVRLNIFQLFRYFKEEFFLILGTSTAEPALPGLMRKLQFMGVERSTVGLVVPTGYSFNLDGAAIYLSLATLYIAQATDTALSIPQQLGLLAVMLLTSKGAAGVAGGGFIALTATLSTVGSRPRGGHHAHLRHRQVHVGVPGAGELLRQRRRHPVRRPVGERPGRGAGAQGAGGEGLGGDARAGAQASQEAPRLFRYRPPRPTTRPPYPDMRTPGSPPPRYRPR